MTQPVRLEPGQPTFHPHVCIRCGVGPREDRPYFIDIGVSLLDKFDPRYDGSIYYCTLCADNLLVDLNRVISQWRNDHPVEILTQSTYDWEKDLHVELGTSSDGDSGSSEQHYQGTDESSGEPEESDGIPVSTVSGAYEPDAENGRNDIRLDFGV